MATAHFEPSVETAKVCHDRVPLDLCCDRAIRVAIMLLGQAHNLACERDRHAHIAGMRARQRLLAPCHDITFVSR